MGKSNNEILFTFVLIFILIGTFSPIINSEFNNEYTDNNVDDVTELAQEDITSSTAVQILSGIFFWVFGAPFWLNIILTVMRLIFWVIVYDKIRGI